MNIKYRVELTSDERTYLQSITGKGNISARKIKRANILLMADKHAHSDKQIADALSAGTSTVYRTKCKYVEEGLETALAEGSQPGGSRLLSSVDDRFSL